MVRKSGLPPLSISGGKPLFLTADYFTILSTSAATDACDHRLPSQCQAHRVPFDPKVCTSPADAPDRELRNSSCTCSAGLLRRDRVQLFETNQDPPTPAAPYRRCQRRRSVK